jgi:hopanoid-associated phosphorylase
MRRPPVLAACGLAFEAAIAAGPGVAALCGPGGARLAARLDAVLGAPSAPGRPAWAGILSFGCAAGLDPALAPGACVVATGIFTPEGLLEADPDWIRALSACLPDARCGRVAGIDLPLLSRQDKADLWRRGGAVAADMESHAAALAARRHGLPFAALRVVLDPAWRGVPACALAGMGADGGTVLAPLLRALGKAPRELAPLCALALDAWLARRALRRARLRLGHALAAPYLSWLEGAPPFSLP